MEANIKDVNDTEHLDEVPWSQLTPKQKQQRQANSPAGIRARKKHLKKRVQYPISLNTELKKDQEILDVLSSSEFSLMRWFRFDFEEYSQSEKGQLKKGTYVLPAMLIEKALEDGHFDLNAYLEAKGQKVTNLETNQEHIETSEF